MITKKKHPMRVLFFRDHENQATTARPGQEQAAQQSRESRLRRPGEQRDHRPAHHS